MVAPIVALGNVYERIRVLEVMQLCRQYPRVSYWTAWSLLGVSAAFAYFARRRVRDRQAVKIFPVTPVDQLYQLVNASPHSSLIVKVSGRVESSRSLDAPISGTKCVIYVDTDTFSFSSREGVSPMFCIQDAKGNTSNVRVSPELCVDSVGGRYFYLQKEPIWKVPAPFLTRVWRFFRLQREYVLPIHTEVLIIAEARRTATREIALCLPHELSNSMWQSRRRALTYFITRLTEKELVRRIERKIFLWGSLFLASFISGYTLMIVRHQAVTGRGPEEPLVWGALQLVSTGALSFWLREEQIRATEHLSAQLENYVLESKDPSSPRNVNTSRVTECFSKRPDLLADLLVSGGNSEDDIYLPSRDE